MYLYIYWTEDVEIKNVPPNESELSSIEDSGLTVINLDTYKYITTKLEWEPIAKGK